MDSHQSQGWERTGTLEQMRKELRVSIESTVEKSVMETQMNKSKVPQYFYRALFVLGYYCAMYYGQRCWEYFQSLCVFATAYRDSSYSRPATISYPSSCWRIALLCNQRPYSLVRRYSKKTTSHADCHSPFAVKLSTSPQVLATKDWTKWDWDIVDDIVQDTLPHAPRLVDALRTKWIKRVSGFYRFVGASGTSTER